MSGCAADIVSISDKTTRAQQQTKIVAKSDSSQESAVPQDKPSEPTKNLDHKAAAKPASSKPILYVFGGEWCGYCKRFDPIIAEVKRDVKDIEVQKVDVMKEKHLAKKHGILVFPSVVFKGNKKTGLMDAGTLKAWLDEHK